MNKEIEKKLKVEWIWPEENGDDKIKTILGARGITDEKDLEEFFSDKPQLCYNPFLMKDLKEAIERIKEAASNNESICVYGDYDCDGVCSVCLLVEVLRCLDIEVGYHVPSRFDEGYGLNKDALVEIKNNGYNLVITVDCGSTSKEEIRFAKEIGLDVIVTDHHTLPAEIPDCLVINPKQDDCNYPFKDLSGCGVAFKLAQGLVRSFENPDKKILKRILDLVAIATIADVVTLLDENRTMVKYGLRQLGRGERKSLNRLLSILNINKETISAEQIAFKLAPHINAVGRVSNADIAVSFLLDEGDFVSEILENNKRRKKLQESAYDSIVFHALKEIEDKKDIIIVVSDEDVHEGITGIVAGKLKEAFYRPVVVLTDVGDGILKGTGRSIEGINLHKLLSMSKELFEKFGGHEQACGFTMKKEHYEEFRKRSFLYMEGQSGELLRRIYIDMIIDEEEVEESLLLEINKMEPFGNGNEEPLFALSNVIPKDIFFMGENKQHLRFSLNGKSYILFNKAKEFKEILERSTSMDIAGHMRWNEWNNTRKIQFVISDFKCGEEKVY